MSARDRHVDEQILAYLAGELNESDAARVREHLDSCDSCRQAERELLALQRVMDTDVVPEPDESVWPAVHARVQPAERKPLQLRWVMSTVTAAAVGVLIGLLVGARAPAEQDDSVYSMWAAVGSSFSTDRSIASDLYGEPDFEGASK